MRNSCIDCKHGDKAPDVEPCASCGFTNWEPMKPTEDESPKEFRV